VLPSFLNQSIGTTADSGAKSAVYLILEPIRLPNRPVYLLQANKVWSGVQ
jgi:hypothetical protein